MTKRLLMVREEEPLFTVDQSRNQCKNIGHQCNISLIFFVGDRVLLCCHCLALNSLCRWTRAWSWSNFLASASRCWDCKHVKPCLEYKTFITPVGVYVNQSSFCFILEIIKDEGLFMLSSIKESYQNLTYKNLTMENTRFSKT